MHAAAFQKDFVLLFKANFLGYCYCKDLPRSYAGISWYGFNSTLGSSDVTVIFKNCGFCSSAALTRTHLLYHCILNDIMFHEHARRISK